MTSATLMGTGVPDVNVKYTGIKALMARKGITRADLADKLGVHYNTAGNWLNGVTSPDMENVIEMLMALGYSLDEIMEMPLRTLIDVEQ